MNFDNIAHREKMREIVGASYETVEQQMETMKIDCEKLLMKADHLEHINNTHHADKKAMNDAVA